MPTNESIRVIARFRPSFEVEQKSQNTRKIDIQVTGKGKLLSVYGKEQHQHKNYSFDEVMDEKTKPAIVFTKIAQPICDGIIQGYNGTIITYGQSGSGKTYTMMGPENNVKCADEFGLVPRCIIYLFQKLDERLSQNGGKLQDYIVNMELLQIYKTQLLDLLNPLSKKKLVIKTNFSTDGVFIQNLKSVQIQTVEESFKLLTLAQQNRIVAGHALNEVSSRSHMLIMMTVIQRCIDGTLKTCKLNFGDLAGSEDLTKTHLMNDMRRKEAIAINQSLSALTTAVSYLSRGQKPGFRDSPLTHILKDSLGGNSKTVMFVACSPHIYNRNETIRTLRFAQTAKKVKNKAKKNEEQSTASLKKKIKELELKVASLQAQLVEARGKQHVMSKVMSRMHIGGIDTGGGGRSLSLSVSHKYKKPGPIPSGSPRQTFNIPSTIVENKKKMRRIHSPHMGNIQSNSISMSVDNMIKISHNQNEEWSTSDEDAVFSDQELIDEERVDELLKDEEELNYIHEIGELRRQLEDALQQNRLLNTEINTKNSELEQCNNTIAQLSEEADNAHKEVVTVKRKLSYNHEDNASLPVPGFNDDISGFQSDEISNNMDGIGTSMKSLPEIPDAMPTIIDDNLRENNTGPYPLQNMLSNNDHGHYKSDSSFSFDQNANNTMLNYLMELQDSMKEAKKDMYEFKKDIFEGRKEHIQKIQTMRQSFINNELVNPVEFSDRDSTQSEQSDDTHEIEKREKQLDVALKKNLNGKKNKSCFSCFQGDDSDDDDNNGNETSLLVEEYLKNHIR
eukprot:242945_1